MACGTKVDMKQINAEQWDLSTAKRVHYSTTGKPEGPTKGARALPATPVPGEEERRSSERNSSDAQSPGAGSPGGGSPTWKAGVEGETVQYKKSTQRNELCDTVHHAVQDEIDKLIAENQNISNTELRSKLKQALQRELTKPELRKIQSLTTKGNNHDAEEEARQDAEAEKKAARRATLAEMAEDSDDEDTRKVGVRKEDWDEDTQECHFCHKGFGLLRHRHHCRGCGRNACDSCSGETAVLPAECGYGTSAQRICNECCSLLKFQQFQKRGKG